MWHHWTIAALTGVLVAGTAAGRASPPNPAPGPNPTPVAPLTISGPTAVPAYSLVRLAVTGPAVADADWEVLWAEDITRAIDGQEVDPAGTGYLFVGPPGNYRVTAWCTVAGRMAHATTTVTIQPAPAPSPTPGPSPGPGPGPAPPATGRLWAIGVFDTTSPGFAAVGSGQARIWQSTTLAPTLAAAPLDVFWRHYDRAETVPTASGQLTPLGQTTWGEAAIKAGLPALVLVDDRGTVLSSQPLPTDEAGIIAAAKKLRGVP